MSFSKEIVKYLRYLRKKHTCFGTKFAAFDAAMKKPMFYFLLLIFVVHTGFLSIGIFLREEAPKKDIYLTSQADAIIVFGKNSLGLFSIRTFSNFGKLKKFLVKNSITLPTVRYVEYKFNANAQLIKTKAQSHHKVIWKTHVKDPYYKLINAPDMATAQMLLPYVKYDQTQATAFGHGIALHSRPNDRNSRILKALKSYF